MSKTKSDPKKVMQAALHTLRPGASFEGSDGKLHEDVVHRVKNPCSKTPPVDTRVAVDKYETYSDKLLSPLSERKPI